MKPLRILLLADVPANRNSGAAGTEIQLADALERLGHRADRVWADALPHRVRHWNLHHLLEQPRAYRAAIGARAREGAYDVLQVNQPAGWLAAREHRRRGRPGLFVHRSHGYEPRVAAELAPWLARYLSERRTVWRRWGSRLLSWGFERAYRGIEKYAQAHVVSCGDCARFLESRGVPRESIHVNIQAPPPEFLSRPSMPWSEERGRRLLFVGQHAFFKAPMVLAEALNDLLGADTRLAATWVCEDSAHEAARARLAPEARSRVELRGWMPQSDLVEVFDTHGFFLFPSFVEGFGKVFLEAMARGLCVVATEQGGARDLISRGRDGVLVPVGDARALATAVRGLAAAPDRAAAMSSAARATASVCTWERSAQRLAGFYEERLQALGRRP